MVQFRSNLECLKLQYYNYKQCINYKLYIKNTRYNFCKISKVYINIVEYTKSWKSDKCIIHEVQYICFSKKYYIKYTKLKGKYRDYKDLPLKCDSNCKFIIFSIKFSYQ